MYRLLSVTGRFGIPPIAILVPNILIGCEELKWPNPRPTGAGGREGKPAAEGFGNVVVGVEVAVGVVGVELVVGST